MKDTITLLKKQIKDEKNKKSKVDMLYELAYEHIGAGSKKAYKYAKKAYYTSRSINYEDGIKHNIAFYLMFHDLGVINKGKLAKYDDAERYYREKKDVKMLAFLLHGKAIHYLWNLCFARALVLFTEAYKLYVEIGDNHKALGAYLNIGVLYMRLVSTKKLVSISKKPIKH